MNTPNHPRNAVLIAAAALAAACSSDKTEISDAVNTYVVSREDLPINVKEGGELIAVNETVVRSDVEGNATILWLIPEGTEVKPKDKLVELDVSELEEKRASQEIAVEKARNALEQAKTAMAILEKELLTKHNTAVSQRQIAAMELEKLLGAHDGKGSEGKNSDMVKRLRNLVNPPASEPTARAEPAEASAPPPERGPDLIAQVNPQNYFGLVAKVTKLLAVEGESGDPLARDMGDMANKILQQADQIRLAMAQLKVAEEKVIYSRRLAKKQFITQNELERDELDYQSQASKVTIAWNDLELLINYTLERDKIELKQNLENATLEVERVVASNDAERKNSQFDVDAKQKEFEVATERLQNLSKQINNAIIYSPGSGLVVYSKVSRGRGDSEAIEEGTTVRERQSIIILPDNSKLKCDIKVQEAMIDKVRLGMPAFVSAEVRPNDVITGRVTYVAPVADSANRWAGNDKKVYTVHVLLDGTNADESLKAGMKSAATITVDTVPNVLTVPIQSVRRDRAVNYVWKKTPNGPLAVAIQVGANNQEKVEIKDGLGEGDMIYRTPPGGQADPRFEQPAMPEIDPNAAAPAAANDRPGAGEAGAGSRMAGGSDGMPGPGAGGEGRGEGDRPRGGRNRKPFTEMSAEELQDAKQRLTGMAERMPEERRESIDAIIKALDANDLEKAQTLQTTMMRSFMGGRNRGERRAAPGEGGGADGGGTQRNGG
ncbi:MAG: efflux RND transporter periplasmic adaptor subunit [Planctomycetes bacterium]|nr:efflux RND transporter periplasmic adaptor subunit [Planctomycetota bacterium]